MSNPDYLYINVYKYSAGLIKSFDFPVCYEYIIDILVNRSFFKTIACSGSDLDDIVVAFLFANNIIEAMDDIKDVTLDKEKLEINVSIEKGGNSIRKPPNMDIVTSSTGLSKKPKQNIEIIDNRSLPTIEAKVINSCMSEFLQMSELHNLTYGVHSSALCTVTGDFIVFFDDIGRHNAIDKVIGYSIRNGISLRDKMLLSTGRLASEIVSKVIHASIPALISRATTTSHGYELGKKHNLIMIGRARGDDFIIFNGKENILI